MGFLLPFARRRVWPLRAGNRDAMLTFAVVNEALNVGHESLLFVRWQCPDLLLEALVCNDGEGEPAAKQQPFQRSAERLGNVLQACTAYASPSFPVADGASGQLEAGGELVLR